MAAAFVDGRLQQFFAECAKNCSTFCRWMLEANLSECAKVAAAITAESTSIRPATEHIAIVDIDPVRAMEHIEMTVESATIRLALNILPSLTSTQCGPSSILK